MNFKEEQKKRVEQVEESLGHIFRNKRENRG